MNPLSGLRGLHRQTVVVHLLSGQSMRGVLRQTYRDSVALANVRHLDEEADLKGELLIPRSSIDYFQSA